jgi:hypothetical protein
MNLQEVARRAPARAGTSQGLDAGHYVMLGQIDERAKVVLEAASAIRMSRSEPPRMPTRWKGDAGPCDLCWLQTQPLPPSFA